ncbi:MAG: adenylate/guanylate cyclase domain-containing protein [Bacteroidota bacterium]
MKVLKQIKSKLSFIQRYHYRWVLGIAVSWTLIDIFYWLYNLHLPDKELSEITFSTFSQQALLLRTSVVLLMSGVMGYLLIFWLRQSFRDFPLLVNLLIKSCILLLGCFIMNFLLRFSYSVVIMHYSPGNAIRMFFDESRSFLWLLDHSLGWIVLFVLTQITIEFYEKYSPGVFWDILIGSYIRPKSEVRIVMFMDLVDSTAIAERLDSKKYFSFIRDFIYYVSIALLEYGGRIYQYVGDEIVVSWKKKPKNVDNCINAIILSTKLLHRHRKYFMKNYGFIPEFKTGAHVGEVTVGEIGIIKRDIAISGDTMNTAARIRTACTELNCKNLVSRELLEGMIIGWDKEYKGAVELKGKSESIELYSLKI